MLLVALIAAGVAGAVTLPSRGIAVGVAQVRRIAPPSRRLRAESEALTTADVVIIDGDNVRGKLAFRWSAAELAARTAAWATELQLAGKILLFFDHGDAADALWTEDGLAVAFSGRISADDQIVTAVRYLSREQNAVVTVVTVDSELRVRCAKAARCRRHLHVVSPIALIGALQESARASGTLELARLPSVEAAGAQGEAAVDGGGGEGGMQLLRARQIERELRLVAKQLRSGSGHKKRSKLVRRRAHLEQAFWQGRAALPQAGGPAERPAPLIAAGPAGAASGQASSRELTSDRAANTESLRRQLRAAGAGLAPPAGVRSTPSLACYLRSQFGAMHGGASNGKGAREQPHRAPAAPARALGPGARLLALDVGQREGGYAVLDAASGALLAYGGLRGSPLLCAAVLAQLREAIAGTGGGLERLVLEGNREMCAGWRAAFLGAPHATGEEAAGGQRCSGEEEVDVVSVSAPTWRSTMLTRREQQSGKLSAKEAARRIARQLLARSGLEDCAGTRLDTNAAEAICVGHWACAFLWKPAEPEEAAAGGAEACGCAERVEWPWVLVERTIAGEVILPRGSLQLLTT